RLRSTPAPTGPAIATHSPSWTSTMSSAARAGSTRSSVIVVQRARFAGLALVGSQHSPHPPGVAPPRCRAGDRPASLARSCQARRRGAQALGECGLVAQALALLLDHVGRTALDERPVPQLLRQPLDLALPR